MSVYSRAYLQSLPEKRKQDWIEVNVLQPIVIAVDFSAGSGETSYIYKLSYMQRLHYGIMSKGKLARHPTVDELIIAICRKFPDCTVTYEETCDGHQTKAIVIDWACFLGPEVARA